MKIAVACDHGGLVLKTALLRYLADNGYEGGRLRIQTVPTAATILITRCLPRKRSRQVHAKGASLYAARGSAFR